ncbi:hypothetical protein [Bordetella genomosp. 13]|uniref:hypothetical protein n=1 Tax=Bordetella genomosp. 13 TaxID=463040 RepID=UPI0011A7BCC2|nr:hypothetical protein [Bordetella genomosp. 13]
MDYKMGRRVLPALVSIALLSLAGCGGGGGDGDDDNGASNPPATTPVAATRLTGTAATGAALANVAISLTDATGKVLTSKTDADGSFVFDISGAKAPFVLVAADPLGRSVPVVSLLSEVPTAAGKAPTAVVNLTPLTTAVAALLTKSGDPLELAKNPALANVSPATLQAAVAALKTILADILSANGVPANFDPFTTAFVADHSGVDAVIDSLSVQNTTGGLRIASIGDTAAGLVLNQDALSSGALGQKLAKPPVAANYLAALPAALQRCLADGRIGSSEAACATAISSGYRFNGLTNFVDAHIEAAAGVTAVGTPKTLTLLNDGKRALVQIPYTLANGTTGSWTEFVVNTPNGGWQVDGNQQVYEVRLRSFLSRVRILSSPGTDHLEAGVQFGIPAGGKIGEETVTYASVAGPGIAGKAWLAPRYAQGAASLGLLQGTMESLPSPPFQINGYDTALYRWSWIPLNEDNHYTAPYWPGVYNRATRVYDASTIPPYSAYTVTFFNADGVKIGESAVINPALPMIADAGRTLNAWRDLTQESSDAFLSPSGAQAGEVPSVTLSWTETVINGVNVTPALATTQVKSTDAVGFGVHGNRRRGDVPTVSNGVYSLTITAGVPQNGTASVCDPACSFLALTPGVNRLIEFSGTLSEAAIYDDTSFYNAGQLRN